MSSLLYMDKYLRRRPPSTLPGNLLEKMKNPDKANRTKVKITCSYIKGLFGPVGWTDFEEVEPGYVVMYFDKLGFVDISKDCFKEG